MTLRSAPDIEAGIFSANEINFSLNRHFTESKSGQLITGEWTATIDSGKIFVSQGKDLFISEDEIMLLPVEPDSASFTLHDVTIGLDFHWQRKENQVFKGSLKLIIEDGRLTVVNVLSIEDYLASVISSEMRATSSEEFLKAHAVISRSWLLAQKEKSRKIKSEGLKFKALTRTENEIIRWYDREDHKNFDVCADDHCQRYQGITRASTPAVSDVIKATYGEVLMYAGSVCDSRYYKCCGGKTELFENTWEPVSHPYLSGVIDNQCEPVGFQTDLENEDSAEKWILGNPDAFCNTSDKEVLSQVLNDYDQETNDFFRWKVSYSQQELGEIIRSRTGTDFGLISDIKPLERGVSGRIKRLQVSGSLKTMIIGKELEIRKALSKTHLYSSCFTVEKQIEENGTRFILHGAGWGHGVGLCQIGAAMMGSRGYSYKEILMHYFRGASLEKIY